MSAFQVAFPLPAEKDVLFAESHEFVWADGGDERAGRRHADVEVGQPGRLHQLTHEHGEDDLREVVAGVQDGDVLTVAAATTLAAFFMIQVDGAVLKREKCVD